MFETYFTRLANNMWVRYIDTYNEYVSGIPNLDIKNL